MLRSRTCKKTLQISTTAGSRSFRS